MFILPTTSEIIRSIFGSNQHIKYYCKHPLLIQIHNIIESQMNIDFYSQDDIKLRFADEQQIKAQQKTSLNQYTPIETPPINFYELFDIDQSNNNSQSHSKFFSNKNLKHDKDSKQDLTIYLKESLGNLKTRRKTVHRNNAAHLLKNIENIVIPSNNKELIDLFLNSEYFLWFIRIISLVNIIAIFLIDYSFRIAQEEEIILTTANIVSLSLQLFSNCVFTFQILLRLYQSSQNIKNPYLIINLIGTFCCWTTIFFDMIENDSNGLFRIFMMMRIVRAIVRILEVFHFLRTPFEIFMNTIPSLQKLFFPLIILMLFYAISGMALFSGASKYRCAEATQQHEVIYTTYCGASLYHCPSHQTCTFVEDVAERDLNTLENQYDLVNFNNIGNALLTVYHFIYNTNFTAIRTKFTYYINPYVSSLYFISSSIIFCYIFSNLIMVSMSKAYIEEVENKADKQEKQKVEIEVNEEKQQSLFARAISIINLILIVLHTIVICCIYKGMSVQEIEIQSMIDFVFMWIACLILAIKFLLQGKHFFKDQFNIISLVTIGAHLVNLIICSLANEDIIYSTAKFSVILKTIKVIRIVNLLYVHKNIFTYEKYVINVFLQTLYKIKFFIVLILCFIIMFKQLGELLFAYQIRFPAYPESEEQVPYINNFEGFIPSFFSIVFLFFNEAWSETMYNYYHAVGFQAVFFFLIVAFIAFLMLMRLYIAVFLCYFKAELHKKEKKQAVCQNPTRQDLKADSQASVNKDEDKNKSDSDERIEQSSSCFTSYLRALYRSQYFHYAVNFCIFAQSIVIILKRADDSDDEVQILNSIENICFAIYLLEVVLGCLSDGIYFNSNSYLKKSRSNIISFAIIFIIIAAFIPYGNYIINNYLRRITFVKIFTIFRNTNKEMSIIIDSIFVICKNFFNFVFIYTFFLVIVSIIPLKIFYDLEPFHICSFEQIKNDASTFYTEEECHKLGGQWSLPTQNFNNIFESVALMYQLISTQSWTGYLQSIWFNKDNLGWQLYFSVAFFVYNICFLNIFLGFIVETYLQLKDKAYNLNMLKRSQKGWILIKNRINVLFPKSVLSIDPNSPPKRKLTFNIITHQYYQTAFDYFAYINAFLYLITYEDQEGLYDSVLNFFKKLFCAIFVTDTLLKAYALRRNIFFKDNSKLQFIGSAYILLYWTFYLFSNPNHEDKHILEFFLVLLLLMRCKSLLFKYAWCKTNVNSVIDILPKCGNIIKLVCVVLFFYASLGLEIFKYVKPNNIVDNYNIGFNNILTAILTLVKVSVAESWQTVLSSFIKNSNEQNICYVISNETEAQIHHNLGCGTWVAYPYFISFHIIMVLLVINLLIATMASAYDDNYEIEYNSVNIFQLEDCLNLWQKYDPKGTGVVQYKKFWRLTSQIAILFGISKKKLIKRKNKFFQELDLQIYQHKSDPVFCYRFHDVITKFSKIKLQIANLGSQQDQQTTKNNQFEISFDINPDVEKEIKDYIIPFPDEYYDDCKPFHNYKSAETKYIFGLLKKMRQWKHSSTERRRKVGVTKLSSIFDIKSKKLQLDQQSNQTQSIENEV